MVWTEERREFLWTEVVKRFGPYVRPDGAQNWATCERPGRGLDSTFDQFCVDFARLIGASGPGAVKFQIAWGMPSRSTNGIGGGYVRTCILNAAAAYRARFINNSIFDSIIIRATGKEPDCEYTQAPENN